MIGVIVQVHSPVCGSWPGMYMVVLPFHSPASLTRRSCCLPGVAARMQACTSSMVQPGGSLKSGGRPAGGLASFEASAMAKDAMAATDASASNVVKLFPMDMGRLLCAEAL